MEGWGREESGRKIKLLICTINYFAREDFKAAFDFCDHLLLFKITNGYIKGRGGKQTRKNPENIFSF